MAANTKSLQFGTSGTRDIPHQSYINFGSGSYTISFWFKKSSVPSARAPLFHKINSGNNWPLDLSIRESGSGVAGYIEVQQWNGTTNPIWRTQQNVCDNSWHYITIVLNDSGTNRIAVDGVEKSTATHLAVTTANNVRLNSDSTGSSPSGFFIDELVIYNVVLSISEAYSRRNHDHAARGYSNLQGYYKLNDNTNDDSANANHMTGTGGSFVTDVPFSTYEEPGGDMAIFFGSNF
ncbi:MAG: hypothetical protein KatS3mg101_1061 [Patescibacteria group bacterium]|nr:MAG: hypothetical protein KatS3mg101_1061 [Patescibacteria group bacterium]